MGIISTIVIGFIVGLLARAVMPGKQNYGFWLTTGLGVAGSLIATYAGQVLGWYRAGDSAGLIASVVGALIVVAAYRALIANRNN